MSKEVYLTHYTTRQSRSIIFQLSTTNDLLRTPLNNFTSDLAARRASDSIALHSNRVMTEQSIPPPSFMFYQEMCKFTDIHLNDFLDLGKLLNQ